MIKIKVLVGLGYLFIKEILRDKIFFGAVASLFFSLLFFGLIGVLAVGHVEQIVKNLGLAGLEISAVIFFSFVVIFSLYRDRQLKIFDFYITTFNPKNYLLAKTIAFIFICLVYSSFCWLGFVFIYKFLQINPTGLFIPFLFFFMRLCLLTILALILGLTFYAPLLAIISFFAVYLSALFLPTGLKISIRYGSYFQQISLKIINAILPNLTYLAYNNRYNWENLDYFLAAKAGYVLLYIIALYFLGLAIIKFKK